MFVCRETANKRFGQSKAKPMSSSSRGKMLKLQIYFLGVVNKHYYTLPLEMKLGFRKSNSNGAQVVSHLAN